MRAKRECAQCGRKTRGLPDARKVKGVWYCSDGCLLQHESASARSLSSPSRKPRRRWRRRLAWTAAGLLGLFVVLVVIGAIVGPQTSPTASHQAQRRHRHQRRAGRPPTGHKPIPLHARVSVSNIGFSESDGQIDYGLTLVNRGNADAVNLMVIVHAVDSRGRSGVTDSTPVSVIPAGAEFNVAGEITSNVSLKVSKLRASVRVGRLHWKGLRVPLVSNVSVGPNDFGFINVHGTLTNPLRRSLARYAPIYIVFFDRAGRIIDGAVDSTGARVRPRASVNLRVDDAMVSQSTHPASARVSVDTCTYVQCLG